MNMLLLTFVSNSDENFGVKQKGWLITVGRNWTTFKAKLSHSSQSQSQRNSFIKLFIQSVLTSNLSSNAIHLNLTKSNY